MESRKNDTVRCKTCKELLCHTSDCYIFKEKVSKQVHFALATRENVILDQATTKKFKKFRVTCKGYQDAEIICLSLKDLCIGDDQFKKVDDLVKVEQSYVWKVVEDMVIDQVKAVESCYRRTNFPNGHVELPNDIKLEYEPFDYQIECFHHIMNVHNSHKKNSVIFLETGRGKTLISVLTAAKMLELNPDKRILMIVPTVSLVCQQVKIFKTWLPNGHAICCGIFGEMSQTKKAAFCLDEKMRVFVTTAGSFNNLTLKTCTENEGCSDDCLHKLLHIGQFSLLILDESHHCFKNSPYNDVIRAYDQCKPEFRPMILGLTASPIVGSISNPDENIRSYLGNFNASIFYPFYRDILNDSDWAFKKRFNFQFEEFKVDKKEILFRDTLIKMIKDILASISMPLNDGRDWNLNLIRAEINVLLSQEEYGNKHKLVRYCIKMLNCLDSIATDYLCEVVETVKLHHKLIEAKDKILWNQLNLVASFKNYLALLDSLEAHLEGSRSKVDLLKDVLLRHTDRLSKTIVFFQRRKDCRKLKDILSKDPEFSKYNPEYVIGQGFGDGMTNFQVQRCLNDFKSGECRLLLATDILEEGIDVPECNVVIRYDLSKTVKSFIQSRGRARKENSKFIVLTESIEQTKKLLQDEKEMLRAICERTMEDVEERKDDSSLRRLMSQVERLKINAIESIKNIFVEMCSSKSKEEISKILKKHIGSIECSSQKDGLYWIAFELKDSKSCDIYENILQIQFNDPKVKLRPIEPIKSAKIVLSCGSLCHGYFQDDNNFVICDEILEKFSLEVNFDSRNSFLKFVAEDKILMKCSFLSLKNEISISQRPDKTLVIFSLHSAPEFYIHDSDLKQTYVDMRFKPLTFCFKVDMESSHDLWTFRTIFSSGTLKCYDKIISFHQQDNQIKKKYLKLDFEREYFLWSLLTDKFSHLGLSRDLIEVISEIDDVNELYIPRDTTVNTVSDLITLIKTSKKLEKRELKNYLWVKRIIITPCRFVFTGEDAISSNRVFRLLSNKVDDFIDCNIRYEDFSEHLVWQVEPFLPVLKTILLKGIKVGDKPQTASREMVVYI
ncbi:P-loop containing nucleoside triphosphate hydrolase domain-containing protein [Rozella allomycis CSF55]|uniref:p-loop containing nucleoside triphosphate hydrolase domain-containing protein n=1 Tax=Rozella allomycis (strain CSF55) TaxID=988480 RepID=A0A075B389_ROZAC|nr:P-loop containing nucleoside triphosphate hydrolase domain-containing protein [Rozella allomycis CSF55]|eukprot:EPZ36819.1 P-loop containing nucleoside triphosphate hydrolase domain-containing protein [Rozella allomycis CSF55]